MEFVDFSIFLAFENIVELSQKEAFGVRPSWGHPTRFIGAHEVGGHDRWKHHESSLTVCEVVHTYRDGVGYDLAPCNFLAL